MSGTNEEKNLADSASSESPERLREAEIQTASAILSIGGPCRAIGDVYLTCVATAGLGQCRHLRASFEDCAKSTMEGSRAYLQTIGDQWCKDEDDKTFCASQLVNQQLMMQAYEPQKNE